VNRLKLNRWLISILALALCILVFFPEPAKQTISIETKIPDSDYFMENVAIYQFDHLGNQTNKLSAKRLEHSSISDLSIVDEPVLSFIKNSNVNFADDNDATSLLSTQGEWRLTSKQGELTDNKRFMTLLGQVSITENWANQHVQTTIDTSDLVLDLVQNVATTNAKVSIHGYQFRTESLGLDIQFEKEIFLLKQNVSTEIYQ
jgi:LPS export ABC transporter protein LptC